MLWLFSFIVFKTYLLYFVIVVPKWFRKWTEKSADFSSNSQIAWLRRAFPRASRMKSTHVRGGRIGYASAHHPLFIIHYKVFQLSEWLYEKILIFLKLESTPFFDKCLSLNDMFGMTYLDWHVRNDMFRMTCSEWHVGMTCSEWQFFVSRKKRF